MTKLYETAGSTHSHITCWCKSLSRTGNYIFNALLNVTNPFPSLPFPQLIRFPGSFRRARRRKGRSWFVFRVPTHRPFRIYDLHSGHWAAILDSFRFSSSYVSRIKSDKLWDIQRKICDVRLCFARQEEVEERQCENTVKYKYIRIKRAVVQQNSKQRVAGMLYVWDVVSMATWHTKSTTQILYILYNFFYNTSF